MTPSSNSADAVSKPWPMPLEVVLYPFHFIPRVLVKILVFLAALFGIVAASLAALVGIWLLLLLVGSAFSDDPMADLIELVGQPVFGLVAAIGLLGALVKTANNFARDSLREIGKKFQEMVPGWLPPLDFRRSVAETWSKYRPQIVSTLKELWTQSFKLYFALVLLVLLLFCFYALAVVEGRSKENVQKVLESVTELQARPAVVVVSGGKPAESPPDVATLFHSGDVYSVAHVEQGSLKVGTGICLDDHVSLPWLNTFKIALEECAEKMPGCRPKVTVRGFASNAPVGLPDALSSAGLSQAVLNCEIANRRAEEVVNFLVSEGDYKCQAGAHELLPYGKRDPCKRSEELFEFGEAERLAFDVRYEPWRPPEAMVREKPADDGDLQGEQGERRHKVEFFNRAVQLTLSNYGCDREQCEAPSQEEGTGEQGAASNGDDAKDKAGSTNNGTPDERVETE